MSRKTRKLMWSVPLVAVLAVVGALAIFMTLTPNQAAAQDAEMLGPPTGLTATADGQNKIKLSWTGPSGEVIGYRVDVAKDADGAVWEELEAANSGNITTVGDIGRYTHMGLKGGDMRYYRVFAIDSTGDEGAPSAPVSATTAPATKSASPRGLIIAEDPNAPTANQITLEWNSPPATGGSDITTYKIQRSKTGTSGWSDLKTLRLIDRDLLTPSSTPSSTLEYGYQDKNLMASTTWHYRVIAINDAGESDPSDVVDGATIASAAPAAPGNLQVQGANSQVTLYWTAPANPDGAPVTGYRIERSTDGNTPWTPIVRNTRSKATSFRAGGAIHTVDDPTTENNETDKWRYQVFAINGVGTGTTGSGTVNARELLPAAGKGPVKSLLARTVDRSSIRLTWEEPARRGRFTTYRVFASKDGSTWTFSAETGDSGRDENYTHMDSGMKADERWYYLVFATTGSSDHIHRVSSRATAKTAPAETPDALVLAAETQVDKSASQINLTITPPTETGGAKVTGYQIRRSTNQITWDTIAANFDHDDDAGTAGIQYHDKKLSAGTTYYYEVRAINSAGAGAVARTQATTTGALAITAPLGLVAVARTATEVDLYWLTPGDPDGSPITGYWIEVSEDSGTTWSNVVSDTRSKATTYTHMRAPSGKTLTYRVSAINSGGAGVSSITEEVMTSAATVPGMPMNVTAVATSDTEITVTWASPAHTGASAVTGYMVQSAYMMADGMMSDWMVVDPAHMGMDMMYMDMGLMPETTYYYRVRAMNAEGYGEWSDGMAMDMPQASAPSGVRVSSLQNTVSVTWDPASIENAEQIKVALFDSGVTMIVDLKTFNAANDPGAATFTGVASGTYKVTVASFRTGDPHKLSALMDVTIE